MRPNLLEPFVKISDADISSLQNVLKQRLPRSAKEYNMLDNKVQTKQVVDVYTLEGDLSNAAIIVLINIRKDFGQDINISVPLGYITEDRLREAFLDTKIIDWDAPYFFTSIDRSISPLLVEISTSVKKNSVMVNPNYQYIFDPSEALQLNFGDLQDNIEVKPLEENSGSKFLVTNWKYTRNGTMEFVQSLLSDKYPSVGVYVNGVLACGALVNIHGLIGLLYSDPNFRRGGYGQLCMRYLFKEMAAAGQIPCSSSQAKNIKSCNFHERLGMVITHETDYIIYTPYSEDKIKA